MSKSKKKRKIQKLVRYKGENMLLWRKTKERIIIVTIALLAIFTSVSLLVAVESMRIVKERTEQSEERFQEELTNHKLEQLQMHEAYQSLLLSQQNINENTREMIEMVLELLEGKDDL